MTWYVEDPEAFLTYSTTAIEQVRTVRLYSETIEHIVEGHVEFRHELPSMIEQIETVIVQPHKVFESKGRAGVAYVFSREDSGPNGTAIYIPVKVIEPGAGLVKTAYFSDEYTGEVVYSQKEP